MFLFYAIKNNSFRERKSRKWNGIDTVVVVILNIIERSLKKTLNEIKI